MLIFSNATRCTLSCFLIWMIANVMSFAPANIVGTCLHEMSTASSRGVTPTSSTVSDHHHPLDYYEILGVSPYTSSKDIKAAFRTLAKNYHPDSKKDSASKDRFYEITRAYSVLKDPELRHVYNVYGEQGLKKMPKDEAKKGYFDDDDDDDPYEYLAEDAKAFQKGLKMDQISGGDFHLGGVFQPIQPPEFGEHINNQSGNTVRCNFNEKFGTFNEKFQP